MEADLEPEFVETLAAQEDSDAVTITTFEGELEDMFHGVTKRLDLLRGGPWQAS